MKILVDFFTVPIGRLAMKHGHECHMLDINNIPIVDSFDKFLPDICILHSKLVNPNILKRIQERPNINLYALKDRDVPITDTIMSLDEFLGSSYTVIEYNIALWDSLLFPETNVQKQDVEIYLDGKIPAPNPNMKQRIFNREVVKSQFYCGQIENNQKYMLFSTAKKVHVGKEDWYNAAACGCDVIRQDQKELRYKDNDIEYFYKMIMGKENDIRNNR